MSVAMTPKVSIVLPVFNGGSYLRECIGSVLAQRLSEFELVIGDDCSTDISRSVIESFSDERIRYAFREKNLGLFGNLNQLIKEARAPLVRILCQDDILEKECLADEISFFEEHPDIAMSFCKMTTIDENGKEIERAALKDLPEIIEPVLSSQLFLYYGCIPGNLTPVCVRRVCFETIGLFDESFRVAADYDLWVRICQGKKMGVIHKHLVRVRSHSKQLGRAPASGVQCIAETRKIRSALLTMVPGEIRPWARLYIKLRPNVLAAHHSVRCVLQGRLGDFLKIVRVMGVGDFSFGVLCWLVTGNNHFYRPRPKVV